MDDPKLNELLNFVSNEEMDRIAGQYGPLEGMKRIVQLAVERASSSEIRKIKDMLDGASYGNRVPQEVKDYINIARAKFMYHNRGLTMQMAGDDDRLGENMDNILIHLGYWKEGDDIKISVQKLQDDMANDGEGYLSIGSILMRTIPESLKILIFYLKIKNIGDIQKIVSSYDQWRENMGYNNDSNHRSNRDKDSAQDDFHRAASYRMLGYNHHFQYHFREVLEDFVTISEDISRSPILWYIKKFHISDIDTFTKFLFGEAYTYGFFLLANVLLVEYFLDANKISSLEQFEAFLKDDDIRNALVSFSQQDGGVGNLLKFLRRFDLKDPRILKHFDSNLRQALIRAKPENLDILFGIFGIKSQEELTQLLGNESVRRSIESVVYTPIWELLWIEGLFELKSDEKSQIFFSLLSKGVTQDLSESIKNLSLGLKSSTHLLGLGEVLLRIFDGSSRIENIDILVDLVKIPIEKKNGVLDFRKLLLLSDFLDGTITPYLSREILASEKLPQSVLSDWQNTIESFKDGSFDSNSELHRNLEYRKFRKLSSNKVLKKYMGKHFGIGAFLSLFKEQSDNYMTRHLSHEEAEFELECLIHEANILKDRILDINEIAKREGRKIIIVPNLSYGYLPVSAIADELHDPNIEFYYGAKVGSTESHHNRDVISSSLLVDIRDRFMRDQPILIVVDGTTNIQTGNVKNIKYPDAYEGYLNQMIAWNYIQGLDDPKKVDYSVFGKTEQDIERLFENEEFQRTVEIYKLSGVKPANPYRMVFYNTGDLALTIRDDSSDSGKMLPRQFSLQDTKGPSLVFCNVGVLHDQLPQKLKDQKFKHTPAYFDDSGRIIALEYSFNKFGLQIVNPIEKKIAQMKGKVTGIIKPKILN